MDWNNLNNLNNPPGEQSLARQISRLARDFFIPILVPLSTGAVGWLAQRRINKQLQELGKEKETIAQMKEEVESLKVVEDRGKLSGAKTVRASEFVERWRQVEATIMLEEEQVTRQILTELEELKPLLKRRQDIYCDMFTHRSHRHKIEEQLKLFTYASPWDKHLYLYRGMLDIFENDTSCGGERNGSLMWTYMLFWQTQAQMLKYKRMTQRMRQIDLMPTD